MKYMDQNLQVIKKEKPDLYHEIKECYEKRKNAKISYSHITMISTKEEEYKALIYQRGEEKIRFNSAYHPVQEAKRWAEKFDFPNYQSVIECFGLGNGFFIRELMKRLKKEDTIVIFEPAQDIFWYCMENYNLEDIFSNKQIFLAVLGLNEVAFDDALLKNVYWGNLKSQYTIELPHYKKLFEKEYQWFQERIEISKQRAVINETTDAKFGKRIIDNLIENLPLMVNGNLAQEIKPFIKNEIPAIVIASGPSLKKNVKELKKAKGKAILFAADSSLNFLEQEGIKPDFSVTIDPNKACWHFQGDMAKNIPIICKMESEPEILHMHHGKKFFYNSHPFLEHLYEQEHVAIEDFQTGGSVATAAISICISLGFQRIIFIGLDLAYDGETTHVDGRQEANLDASLARYVEGVNGDYVKTRYDWGIYLDWIASSIRTCPEPDYIDATEGGAKIPGTRGMTAKEAVENYCCETISMDEILKSLPPTLDKSSLQRTGNYLEKMLLDLEQIKRESESAVWMMEEMITSFEKRKDITKLIHNYTDKLNHINEEIEGTYMYQLIDTYMTQMMQSDMQSIYQEEESEFESIRNTYERGKRLYLAMIEAAEELQPKFKNMIKRFQEKVTQFQ